MQNGNGKGKSESAAVRGGTELEVAEHLREPSDALERMREQLRKRWTAALSLGNYEAAFGLSEQFQDVELLLPPERTCDSHHGMASVALHLLGRHNDASKRAQQFLSAAVSERRARPTAFSLELQAATLATVARISWLQGFPERAREEAGRALELGERSKHDLAHCCALTLAAIPIAWWNGNYGEARAFVEQLSEKPVLGTLWCSTGAAYRAAVDSSWHSTLGWGQERAPLTDSIPMQEILATLHPHLITEELLARSRTPGSGWASCEIIRAHGEITVARLGAEGFDEAEYAFLHAMNRARLQGARSWRLRAATSLARLWLLRGQFEDARVLLGRLTDEYTEGFDTADVNAAGKLLAEARSRHRGER